MMQSGQLGPRQRPRLRAEAAPDETQKHTRVTERQTAPKQCLVCSHPALMGKLLYAFYHERLSPWLIHVLGLSSYLLLFLL